MNGNGLDKLTRDLFKSAAQEPSSDLSFRIMEQIAQEAPLKKKPPVVHMKTWNISPLFIIGIITYLIVLVCLFMFMNYKPETVSLDMLNGIKERLPYILTVLGIIGAIPFFSSIDRALSFGR